MSREETEEITKKKERWDACKNELQQRECNIYLVTSHNIEIRNSEIKMRIKDRVLLLDIIVSDE